MKKTNYARALLLAAGVALVAAAVFGYRFVNPASKFDPDKLSAYYSALKVTPSSPVDDTVVRDAVAAAAGYIRRANNAEGEFTYLVNMDPSVAIKPDYSILRHQGTLYSLGMAQRQVPDTGNVEVMLRALRYMRECCYAHFEAQDMTGVHEPPIAIGGHESYGLGGAGLGLIALATIEKAAPGSVPRPEMQRISNLGHYLQNWRGQFYSLYTPGEKGRTGLGSGLYYPGEMALGWTMMYELEPAEPELKATIKGLMFLARSRYRLGNAPSDHWALLSTAQLFKIARQHNLELPREALINHALQICHAMLEMGRIPQPLPAMNGSLVPNGVVTPTATRLEAMQAALTFLPTDHPIVPHIKSAIDRGIDFLVRAQVKDGPFAGGMPGAIVRLPEASRPEGNFNEFATEIRIDYVQHSLSALVQYLERQR